MQKLNIKYPAPAEAEQQKKELADRLAADAMIRNLLYDDHIPVEQLERYPQRFKSWLSSRNICEACRGLDVCTQKQKGYRMGIRFDGILQDTLEACPYRIERDKAEAHLQNYLVSDLGSSLSAVAFETISLTGEDRGYIQALTTAMKACNEDRGLYICGFMGTGKTYLAACAANQNARNGKKVAFVHCPSFMERMRSSLKENEFRTEAGRLMYADFVVFDDIGAEEYNDRTRSILLSILDARMQNRRCTWFTSNHDFKTLQQHFTSSYDGANQLDAMRIVERVRALTTLLEMPGKDRRSLAKNAGTDQ